MSLSSQCVSSPVSSCSISRDHFWLHDFITLQASVTAGCFIEFYTGSGPGFALSRVAVISALIYAVFLLCTVLETLVGVIRLEHESGVQDMPQDLKADDSRGDLEEPPIHSALAEPRHHNVLEEPHGQSHHRDRNSRIIVVDPPRDDPPRDDLPLAREPPTTRESRVPVVDPPPGAQPDTQLYTQRNPHQETSLSAHESPSRRHEHRHSEHRSHTHRHSQTHPAGQHEKQQDPKPHPSVLNVDEPDA